MMTERHRIGGLAARLIAVPLLAACQAAEPPTAIDGNWLTEDIGGRGVVDRVQSTIGFDGQGGVQGSGGCNQYRGSVEFQGEAVTFGPLATTRMACAPALMDQEDKFLAALDGAKSFRFDGPFLLLTDQSGNPLLKLTRLD